MSSGLSLALSLLRPLAVPVRAPARVPPSGVSIDVPVAQAGLTLGATLCAVLAAGAAVSVLAIGLGHDHLMGLARLLDLNSEHNLPTWFSSALLLTAAMLLTSATATAHPALRRQWRLLAIVFALLSLDEMASLHEMSNAPLRAALGAGPLFYFPWIALGLTAAAAVALSQRRLLDALPARTRLLFIAAGALYVGGGVGLEAVAAPVYAASGEATGLHAGLVFVEEGLEMRAACCCSSSPSCTTCGRRIRRCASRWTTASARRPASCACRRARRRVSPS